jgi:23S rRNA (adenine2503-C2)-methyltransferase
VTTEDLPWEKPTHAATSDRTGGAGASVDVLTMDLYALEELVRSWGERPFRAKQIFAWIHQKGVVDVERMTDLPQSLRERLGALRAPVVDEVKRAKDGTRKYSLKTHDGHYIEAVFIPNASGPGKNALCISSQVGCAMGCTFCATASMKLTRHLTPGEIVGQLYAVIGDLEAHPDAPAALVEAFDDEQVEVDDEPAGAKKRHIQNIVFMGMGEPLHNVDGVLSSIRLLTHPAGQNMSPRRITVSTSGLVPAIARLGVESDVHLAVSLNATTDEVRREVMPVDKRYDIATLLDACRKFPLKPRRRITFEYVMLAGINDSDDDARRLVKLVGPMKCKVNLIPYNPHPLSPFTRPDDVRVEAFRDILDRAHVSCFVRTTRGLDIDAACGMLGAKKLEAARASSLLPIVDQR